LLERELAARAARRLGRMHRTVAYASAWRAFVAFCDGLGCDAAASEDRAENGYRLALYAEYTLERQARGQPFGQLVAPVTVTNYCSAVMHMWRSRTGRPCDACAAAISRECVAPARTARASGACSPRGSGQRFALCAAPRLSTASFSPYMSS